MKVRGIEVEESELVRPWMSNNHRRRLALLRKQGCQCWYCGCDIAIHPEHHELGWNCDGPGPINVFGPRKGFAKPVIEHQNPRLRGGLDDDDNVVLSCWACNSRKGRKTVEEFRVWWMNKSMRPVRFHGEMFAAFGGVA